MASIMGGGVDAFDELGYTALHRAVIKLDLDEAEKLLSGGANPNLLCADKQCLNPTVFSMLCQAEEGEKALQVAKLLLGHNADLETKDLNGGNALHSAVKAGKTQLVQLFIDHGVELTSSDGFGQLPLCHAVSGDMLEMCNILTLM